MAKLARSRRLRVSLLVATRKGLWQLHADASRRSWRLAGPQFLGHIVHHCLADPRDGKTVLAAARTGHLGPTIFRSVDRGRTWHEAAQPPAFREGGGRVVDHTFWLTPGHASEPNVWYAGTSPQGLFRSNDGGATWRGVDGFNEHPMRKQWCGDDKDGTPDGPKMHSILIDPRDANHMYIGCRAEACSSRTTRAATGGPLNRGDQSAISCPSLRRSTATIRIACGLHPALPDRLYQQNHCGIYRLDRPADRWEGHRRFHAKKCRLDRLAASRASARSGHALGVPHGWRQRVPRVSPAGRPAVYRSVNGGRTWQRQAKGLPKTQAWLTVKRQAMSIDDSDAAGVYFGTTSGTVWASRDEGRTWKVIAAHLPEIYAVETV